MDYWGRKAKTYQHGKRRRQPDSSVSTIPAPPLGGLIRSLYKINLNAEASDYADRAVIKDCKLIASYNWLDVKEPTIVVPGKPPKWTPLKEPTRLKEDSGEYFRDRNAARYPKHPMEPAVIASLPTRPNLPSMVDVVACGSTLGNLLRFIRGQDKTFRILVELVHNTVFFIRRENSPTETIPNVRGYGHSFPEAYTTWEAEVKGSSSHQRMLHYSLGGLRFLVRYEADGWLDNTTSVTDLKKQATALTPSVEQLAGILSSNKVSSESPIGATEVRVTHGGSFVDQSLVFDLKTRGSWKKLKEDVLYEELPRLWIAQVSKFILAYHQNGIFKDIGVQDVAADVKQWEKAHVDDISRLAALIHRIIALVSKRPDGKLELCHSVTGTLEVREQLPDAGDALSPEVKALWQKASVAENEDNDVVSSTSDDGKQGLIDTENHIDSFEWDRESEPDYTACSADSCGYCGKCTY